MAEKKFLTAIDHTIVDCIQTGKVKKRLISKKLNLESYEDITEHEAKNYEVYLRIKPGPANANVYTINDKFTFSYKIANGWKQYSFDSIFDEGSSQIDVFNTCVKANLVNFINGRNVTLMSYGASGSGKTFTILGNPNEPGIIPRAINYLFMTLPTMDSIPKLQPFDGMINYMDDELCAEALHKTSQILKKCLTQQEKNNYKNKFTQMQAQLRKQSTANFTTTATMLFSVWVSYIEIYNEDIYDLLVPPQLPHQKPKLKMCTDPSGNIFVKDMTHLLVTSAQQAYDLLQFGINNLKYASTAVNQHSSRSHSMFIVTLIQSNDNMSMYQKSKFTFCDLAGSERSKQTHNVGQRLKESNNINSSLHVLNRCLRGIIERQTNPDSKTVIPFRDSKLTKFFKQALTGDETLKMIVNINLNNASSDITQHVLAFSAIAKSIDIIPTVVTKPNSRFTQYLNRDSRLEPLSQIQVSDSIRSSNDSIFEELQALRQFQMEQPIMMQMLETKIRQEACDDFSKILDKNRSYWSERLAKSEAELKAENERLHRLLSEQETQAKKPRLDDSDIEEDIAANYEFLRLKFEDQRIEKNQLENKIAELNNSISELSAKNEQAIKDLNKWQSKCKHQQTIIDDAEKDFLQLKEENDTLREQNNTYQKENIQVTDEVNNLQMEVEVLRTENWKLKERCEELESHVSFLKAENQTSLVPTSFGKNTTDI